MSKKKTTSFNTVVTRIKSEIKRQLKTLDRVSAVNFRNVMRSQADGPSRGAAVRLAFRELINERVLRPTTESVYNPDTKHRVTVYSTR